MSNTRQCFPKQQVNVKPDKLAFSKFIHQMMYKERAAQNESSAWKKEVGRKDKITMRELADKYGMDYEQFRKGINKERPFKERDEIIMICFVLRLDEYDTNKALELYGFLPLYYDPNNSLGIDYNKREDILLGAVWNSFGGENVTFDTVNQQLIAENLQPLQINSSKFRRNYISPYTVVCDSECLFKPNLYLRYNDLKSKYSLNNYSFVSRDYIILKDSNKKLVLEYYESKSDHCKRIYDVGENDVFHSRPLLQTEINYSAFEERFSHLGNIVKRKKKELYKRLDDTKNYQLRVSANFIDGNLHVFAETYNYSYPELDEYYFADYFNGSTTYSISHNSKFLYYHLGDDEYERYVSRSSKYKEKSLISTKDLDELKKYNHEITQDYLPYNLNVCVQEIFSKLNNEISDLIVSIKNGGIFIRNANDIFDGPNFEYEICNFFDCSNLFEFQVDHNVDFDYPEEIYLPSLQSCEVKSNGETILISIDDVITAFNYGLNSIDDIYGILLKYKNMENWINLL